jgi:hypothetical protein
MMASVVQAVGILLVAAGVALWSPAAGLVVVGAGTLAFGLALERRG